MSKVTYSKRAAKGLRKMPGDIGIFLMREIDRWAEGRPVDVKPVKTMKKIVRIRYRDWRALVDTRAMTVLDAGPRQNFYR